VSGAARRAVGTHAGTVLAICVLAFPVVWAALSSFKRPADLYGGHVLPLHPTLANYRTALTDLPLGQLLVTTTVMAVAVAAGQTLLSILAAYAFATFRFAGRRWLYVVVTGTILIPQQCLIVPDYIMVARLGWIGSYLGLIVPVTASCAFGVLLLRAHVEAIPRSLLEAAEMEGARHSDVLWRIVVPVIRPAIGALAVLAFVTAWNEYLWPLLVLPNVHFTTIQVGIASFSTQEGSEYGPMMAAATLATIPVVLAYLLAHRRVTDSFLRAGVR
jgi:multiple sugar transport system permease protein